MIDVITLSPRRGHNGGVGDGRTVVPADRAGHAGGNAHHRQGVIHGKHTLHNGNEHPKGSPAGPCGKSQQAANEVDYLNVEDPNVFSHRAWELEYQRKQEMRRNQPARAKKRSYDMEL